MTISNSSKFYAVVVLLAANCFWQGYRLYGQTRIAPDQLKAPRVVVMTCNKPPIPPVIVTNPDGTTTTTKLGTDCVGLYYVDVVTLAGTELKIVGTVQPDAVNAADWNLVP